MRYTLTALLAASLLVVPVTAQAATGSGSVDASSSATSLKAMKSTLRKDLKRGVKGVRKLDIATIEAKGMTLKRVRALVAGKGSFTATGVRPAAAGQTTPAKRVTVARRSRTFPRRGKSNVRLKLTQSGKKLLQGATRVTLTVTATFRPRTGGRISVRYRVTVKRKFVPQSTPITPVPGTPVPGAAYLPVASGPIPANVTPLYGQGFEGAAPWDGIGSVSQCGQTVQSGTEGADGYARLTVADGDPEVAGNERCELSRGSYDDTLPAGEYWYRTKLRTGVGFPHVAGPNLWVSVQQWQEDRPPAGAGDRVDGAQFVNGGPSGRMYIEGENISPLSQSTAFPIDDWHVYTVHGVWTDQATGYLEWWIDDQYVGRTNGVTSEIGGRHFWKGGITRATALNGTQSIDISTVEVFRAP